MLRLLRHHAPGSAITHVAARVSASHVRRIAPASLALGASFPAAAFHALACSSRARSTCVTATTTSLTGSPPQPAVPARGMKDGRRRRASPQSRKVYGVSLPAYTTAAELSALLKTNLRRLTSAAQRIFPTWWPNLTRRNMRKDGFTEVKEVIFSYEDAAKLAVQCRRAPVMRDLDAEEAAWDLLRPFGPPAIKARPAVISILGHKDHGKTTLLDRMRGGNVAAKEEFGITQETYAFNVQLADPRPTAAGADGKPLPPTVHTFSFLDTPGHVSFTEMRTNVASVSDLILLVVAADEGVLDQTFETLRTARQLDRPLVVVINKCDLPGAKENVRRIRQELSDLGAKLHSPDHPLVSTKGDLVVLELSALHDQTGFSQLRETLIRVMEQIRPRFDANAVPVGRVVEAMVAQGRGNVLRVALTQGTLRVGQSFTAEGVFEGRVKEIRAMRGAAVDATGRPAEQVGLSLAGVGAGVTVDITGCVALANPGAEFRVRSTADMAKLCAATRRNEIRYQDQQRVVDQRAKEPQQLEDDDFDEETAAYMQQHAVQRQTRATRATDVDDEEEYDEVEEVDELAETDVAEHDREFDQAEEAEEFDDDDLPTNADDVPIDLDPRSRVAPPLPPRSTWELSPPPPPTQRALPIANLKPKFKFYSLASDSATDASDPLATSRNTSAAIEAPAPDRKFGLNLLLKTANMGALTMLRHAVEDMNVSNAMRNLPEVHISYAAAGDITKKDLVNAEAEGCWIYGFRVARPSKPSLQQARSRRVPLFAFRHHQHLLDHLQHHIEQSPTLTEEGEAKIDDADLEEEDEEDEDEEEDEVDEEEDEDEIDEDEEEDEDDTPPPPARRSTRGRSQ